MEKTLQAYRYKFLVKRDRLYILFSVFAFFIGQSVFYSFANPFFAPFLSLFLGENNFIFTFIFASIVFGAYFCFSGVFFYTYLVIASLMFLFNIYINYEKIKINSKTRVMFSSVATLIGGLVPVFLYGMSTYFLVYFCVFALTSGLITSLMYSGFQVITLKKNINNIKTIDIVGFSLLISAILIGVLNLELNKFNLFLYIVLLISFVLTNSSLKNSSLTFAFIVCIIPFMTKSITATDIMIILLIVFAVLVTVNKDKKYTVLSAIPMSLLAFFYVDNDFFVQKNILAILLAMSTYVILPNDFYEKLQSKFGLLDNSFYPYANKITEYYNLMLSKCSRTFDNLSSNLEEQTKVNKVITSEDYKKISESVVDKVCKDCKCYNTCFVETSYTTENTIKNLLKAIETNDTEFFNNQIFTFSKICLKKDEFMKVLSIYNEFLTTELQWKNKLLENKYLACMQLNEVSKVFNDIKSNLSKAVTFLPKYEKQILYNLNVANIYPQKVLVMQNESVINIYITININLDETNAFKVISNTCNEVIGKKVKIINTSFIGNQSYEIELQEVNNYDISFAVSTMKKNEVSGDSYSTMNFANKKALLAISDGMGSGEKASKYSTMTLNLFEEFLEAGFDINVALKLINSSLILKNNNDSFSTIDSIIVDLYKGEALFIKIGSVKSFILRGEDVISINSKSLPIGILKEIEPKIYKKQLKQNDYVILISDGVLDVHNSYEKQEQWIKDLLKTFKGRGAKDLSEFILSEALKVSNNEVKDDMTVVCGRISKNR